MNFSLIFTLSFSINVFFYHLLVSLHYVIFLLKWFSLSTSHCCFCLLFLFLAFSKNSFKINIYVTPQKGVLIQFKCVFSCDKKVTSFVPDLFIYLTDNHFCIVRNNFFRGIRTPCPTHRHAGPGGGGGCHPTHWSLMPAYLALCHRFPLHCSTYSASVTKRLHHFALDEKLLTLFLSL